MNVVNEFKTFLSSEAMVDVTLACGDGQSFKAHKTILSAYSPLFKSLFLKNPCEHPIVILKDIEYRELKLVIDFIYCGEVAIAEDLLSTVIKTARTLGVKGLGEVKLPNNQSEDRSKNSTCNVSKNQFNDKIHFKWNNHIHMMDELKNFLFSESMVDTTLICGEQSLKAHKIVLAANSPFFRSLFLENPCKHTTVILKDMEYTELRSVIDFMYSSKRVLTENQSSAVIKIAEILKVKDLAKVESQRSQCNDDESENSCNDESRNAEESRCESENQFADKLPEQQICLIDVSNWKLSQGQSVGNQSIDKCFVREIKEESLSDTMDVNVSCSNTPTLSLQSHEANNLCFQSEQDEPIDQDFALPKTESVESCTLPKTTSQKSLTIFKKPRTKPQKNPRSKAVKRMWDKMKMAEAIKKVRNNEMSFKKASKVFEVPRTTLRRLAQQVEKLPEVLVEQKSGRKPVLTDQLERELVEHLLEMQVIFHGFTRQDVRKMAFQLAENNKIPHPFHNESAGRVWLDNFLARNKNRLSIWAEPEASCDQTEKFSSEQVSSFSDVQGTEYAEHIQLQHIPKIKPDTILNVDESGHSFTSVDLTAADHSSGKTNLTLTSTDSQPPKLYSTTKEMSMPPVSPSSHVISTPSTSKIPPSKAFVPVPFSKKKTPRRGRKQNSVTLNTGSSNIR